MNERYDNEQTGQLVRYQLGSMITMSYKKGAFNLLLGVQGTVSRWLFSFGFLSINDGPYQGPFNLSFRNVNSQEPFNGRS
ncbi:hypothetical protein ABKN59_006359 [Abortiporus biennis]